MLFTAGLGYFLFVSQGTLATNQANASRQNAQLQAGQEALLPKLVLSGTTFVVSANNTGGTPVTISSIYVADNTGKIINPPGIMGQAATNVSAAQWPLTLSVGESTNALTGCVAGKTGCNIALSGFSYSPGSPVTVEIVTAKGDLFSAPYPPPALTTTTSATVDSVTTSVTLSSIGNGANALVAKMVATPSQVLSGATVTDTVTVYNYASSAVTGVTISMNAPGVTGTAGLALLSACSPSPQTVAAYSGSGNPPSITFSCTYTATTGAVGGFGSFSGSASGTLTGVGITSAEALSNSIQIGGSSNVPTQGAFAANFFFLKYSACQNAPSGSAGSYTYSSPCSSTPIPMPPTSLDALANGNYISGFSDYYVAYYVQVTNNFNATLPLLEYSYLFMDPGVSEEAYNFLVGTATSPQVPYFPNYCSSGGCAGNDLPTFTSYAATAATCAESGPSYNAPSPTTCIDVAPGQTVTLTFAACGFGSANWMWGGTAYAQQFDNGNDCNSSPPGYQHAVPEGQTLAVVLSYVYKNQVYSQVMPFEGQAVTNLRTASTAVACSPSPDAVNAPSTCTVTVTDLSSGTPITPTGTVTLSQNPAAGGTLSSGGACTLAGAGASATCTLTFTPSLGQEGSDTLTATYPGDTNHSPSAGITSLTVTPRTTSTSVVCTPSTAVPNTPTSCVITVTDTSAGTSVTPTGTITMAQNPLSSGTFTPAATCTLASGTCTVTYTPNLNFAGTVTITGSYGGDTDHSVSSQSTPVTWGRTTTTAVVCVPNSLPVKVASTCTATVTDTATGAPITPTGTVSFFQSSPALGTFSGGGACTLAGAGASATCSVTFTPGSGQEGAITITASYPGDASHLLSSGSTSITANKRATSTAISCPSQPHNGQTTCTFTVSDTSPGTTSTPTGTVDTFSDGGRGGTFGGASCALVSGVCSVTYTPSACGTSAVAISATYEGDTNHLTSTGGTSLALTMTFAKVSGTSPVDCVPVTITNSQASATPSGFQEMITVNSNNYHAQLASDLSNVNWQDGNGNILNSWRESGVLSTDTSDPYWINLGSNTISGGGGTLVIYYTLYPTSLSVLNTVNTGVAPQLTGATLPNYGKYDDGANVFTQYGGASWSTLTKVEGTWDTTNGYLEQTATAVTGNGGPAALIEGTSYPANGNYIIESAFSYTSQANARVGLVAVQTLNSGDPNGYRFICQQGNNGNGCLSFLNDLIVWEVNNAYQGVVSTSYTMSVVDRAGTWSGTLYSGYGVTGASLTTLASTAYTAANNKGATTGYVGVSAAYYTGSAVDGNPAHFQWFRLRQVPPSNVMPSASFGSLAVISSFPPPMWLPLSLLSSEAGLVTNALSPSLRISPSLPASIVPFAPAVRALVLSTRLALAVITNAASETLSPALWGGAGPLSLVAGALVLASAAGLALGGIASSASASPCPNVRRRASLSAALSAALRLLSSHRPRLGLGSTALGR